MGARHGLVHSALRFLFFVSKKKKKDYRDVSSAVYPPTQLDTASLGHDEKPTASVTGKREFVGRPGFPTESADARCDLSLELYMAQKSGQETTTTTTSAAAVAVFACDFFSASASRVSDRWSSARGVRPCRRMRADFTAAAAGLRPAVV